MSAGSQSDLGSAVNYALNVSGHQSSEVALGSELHECLDPVTLILEISPEHDEAMEEMAIDLEGSKSDVFVRAMALFQLAIDAKKQGKRVCITNDELNVETEITGFGPLDDESETEVSPLHE